MFFLLIYGGFASQSLQGASQTKIQKTKESRASNFVFSEVWAYLMAKEESFFPKNSAITDVAYFCARINKESRLGPAPLAKNLPSSCASIRKHLVIACAHNKNQMRWILRDLKVRANLIEEITSASKDFDGIQIDFEGIRSEEADCFLEFLADLRKALSINKILSVAVMPKFEDSEESSKAFAYDKISNIVDRVIVMAYDQHTQTTAPGPVASRAWIQKVASYSQKNIPRSKLIMGVPLYGRIWQVEEIPPSMKHSNIEALIKANKLSVKRLDDGTPTFEYYAKVKATCYFEDIDSLKDKLSYYQSIRSSGVAFWRISQEPQGLWELINPVKEKSLSSKKKK